MVTCNSKEAKRYSTTMNQAAGLESP